MQYKLDVPTRFKIFLMTHSKALDISDALSFSSDPLFLFAIVSPIIPVSNFNYRYFILLSVS